METNYKLLTGKAEELVKDEDKLERMLQKLEKKLKVIPMAGDALSYVPVMISMVRAYIKKEYPDVPVGSITAIVVALLYVLSPIDLIPDAIPVAGYLDDGAVVAGCLCIVKTDILDYIEWRKKNGHVIEDLPDYDEVEKQAQSNEKVLNAFFKGRKSAKK